jgi:hypothetical protein
MLSTQWDRAESEKTKKVRNVARDPGHLMSHMHYIASRTWYQHVLQVSHDATWQNRRSSSAHIRELVELLNTRACGLVDPDSLPICFDQSAGGTESV